MLEAPHFSAAGAKRKTLFALPADYFDGTVNEPVLHQAVKVYLGNQRQGTHMTKTRAFVSGGNQKPWKQKGTGRARQGSTRAPHWRGGGTVFGPQPRDYRADIPRKVRQLARRSALNARAREGSLYVIEQFGFSEPKTSRLAELLNKVGVDSGKALLLTRGSQEMVYLSGRNIPNVEIMNYTDATAYHVLWADTVVVEEGALTGEAPPELPAPESDAAEAEAGTRGKSTTKKSSKKAAGRSAKKAVKTKAEKKTDAKKKAKKAARGSRKGAAKKGRG